MSLPPLPALRP